MKVQFDAYGWKYLGENNNSNLILKVTPPTPIEIPRSLFKLFSVTEYNINGLINNQLYVAHPDQFNDLFDCHKDLVSINSIDPVHRGMLIELLNASYTKEVVDSWRPEILNKNIHEIRTQFQNRAFGIICMNNDPHNVLMWAYYGNNSGYMVEYDTSLIPNNFLGPFPINYQDQLISIKEGDYSPAVSMLYQNTIKSKRWKHEKEWRYLVRPNELKFLTPLNGNDEEMNAFSSRLFEYPLEAVKSIRLGHKFFDQSEMNVSDDGKILEVIISKKDTHDYRVDLLNFCLAQREIDLYYSLKMNDIMNIQHQLVVINKIGDSKYEFIWRE